MRSTSFDVHNCLPRTIQLFFSIQVFQRSACSKHLLQYIKTQILQGVKFFIKISEGLAALNFQEFCRQRRIYLTAATENNELVESSSSSEFYSNVLFSFPSNDQIMNLFLIGFKMESHLYNNEMNSLSATVISCDHTFKISRNVGLVRGDNKFVTQYNQLFIALNERGEVLCWKMTTSTSFTQIEDLLTDLKGRLDRAGSIITNHMNLLQLPQDEDSATFHLRQLFVNELEKEGSEASNFISGTTEEVAQKARAFRLQGVCLIETLEI